MMKTGFCSILLLSFVKTSFVQGEAINEKDEELLSKVCLFANNLIEYARDRYGTKHTPLFVCQLDINSKTIPPADTKLYSTSGRGGAGPTMNNLQWDGKLLNLLYALSRITGERKYAQAADDYLGYYLANLPDPDTGYFPWGDHKGYDVVKDIPIGGPNEFKIVYPPWEELYRINPEATRKQIEALKLHIIDESRSYAFNRHHPPGSIPHSMNSSGGAYIAAWSFLHSRTHDRKYLEWARKMADYFWSVRDAETGLLASHPADPLFDCKSLGSRPTRTEYMGPWTWYASNLLKASELLGSEEGGKFREQALAYIRAFTVRAEVLETGAFYATFNLVTGEPPCPRINDGWGSKKQFVPGGDSASSVTGLHAPISLAFAYRMTRESDLRKTFDTMTPLFRLSGFEDLSTKPKPIAASLLARAIDAFLNMYRATEENHYLKASQILGSYATDHYCHKGFLVCGPLVNPRYGDESVDVRQTYSNRGGSAELALALLRLHLVLNRMEDFILDDPVF